ncbi:MAG TPA: GNAT family N-acetyltransferase [Acidimicrobiales bacterium]|nr:GNAT family N-acetyltransferase [Acidimicrobiales bacterium]
MALPVAERLAAHLRAWLGAWPPEAPLVVATSPARATPGWDGAVHPVVGVASPDGAVLSVPEDRVDAVAALADDLEGLRAAGDALGAALGWPDGRLFDGVFRWSEAPTGLEDAGEWVAVDDPRVPPWLLPFGGEVLMAFDPSTHENVAGVGIKVHDAFGHELAVVTEEASRGRGLARRLVAQAARHVLETGAVPTYLHADANVRSARVADAAGFPDRGWRILGASGGGRR